MDHKFIKIAHLANHLDEKNEIETADQLDLALASVSALSKKISKIDEENRETFIVYNENIHKLAGELEDTLLNIDTKESQEIVKEFKEAGFGDFMKGLGKAVVSPLSGIGGWVSNQVGGAQFKSYVDSAISNMAEVKQLANSGNEEGAANIILEDANKILNLLKKHYGDLTQISKTQQEQKTETAPAANTKESQRSNRNQQSVNTEMGHYPMMQEIQQVVDAIGSGGFDLMQVINFWSEILRKINSIQPETQQRDFANTGAYRSQMGGQRGQGGWYGGGANSGGGLRLDPRTADQVAQARSFTEVAYILRSNYPGATQADARAAIVMYNPGLAAREGTRAL